MDLEGVWSMQDLTLKINDRISARTLKNHCFDAEDCACACSKVECRIMTFQEFDRGHLLLGSFCIKKNGMIIDDEAIKCIQKQIRDEKKKVVCYRCSKQKTRAECEYGKRAVSMSAKKVYTCRDCVEVEKVEAEAERDRRVNEAAVKRRAEAKRKTDEAAWIQQKEQQFAKNRKLFEMEPEKLSCLMCNKSISANQHKYGKCCFECNKKKKETKDKNKENYDLCFLCGKSKKKDFPTCWECK
jgi:hypothetical protein